ncbi:hypothetical protein [Celeribacter halophilus]|uniref:hypothetical protein n=1 Tax=Celeribacter halophilus TaxID=576117 RepID=UPI003A92CB2C
MAEAAGSGITHTSEGGLVIFRVEIWTFAAQRQIEASNTELRAALRKRDRRNNVCKPWPT